MKTLYTLLAFVFFGSFLPLHSQSTLLDVYQIFNQKCISCHSHDAPEAGLDLEGSGATDLQKAQAVFNSIVEVTPANTTAATKEDQYIYPGRPDRSFLFRKINHSFEPTVALEAGEGDPMPKDQAELTNEEKELIRQWILFGAPANGNVVDQDLISDYYNLNGLASFPDGPPPAPAPSEGFQLKMGPFYLPPGGQPGAEIEYFLKYELNLPEDVEVDHIEFEISNFSHHFILYNFPSQAGAALVEPGYRTDPNHFDISIVAAVQEATSLELPTGTAFFWDNNITLDLNAHYINYSPTHTYQAEAYVNVYTKPSGTALHEMKTELLIKDNIYINNNGNEDIETQVVNYNAGEVFVWGIMGHTHQWGTGYKVYERENGQTGDLIYDAACPGGIPGCMNPYFDYQHIPLRYMDPLYPLTFSSSRGIMHEATYVNNGPNPVWFGPTSDDEMMVLVLMYTDDTTGLVTSLPTPSNPLSEIIVGPNPMSERTSFWLPAELGELDFTLYDLLGRAIRRKKGINASVFDLERDGLLSGTYIYQFRDQTGRQISGKLFVE